MLCHHLWNTAPANVPPVDVVCVCVCAPASPWIYEASGWKTIHFDSMSINHSSIQLQILLAIWEPVNIRILAVYFCFMFHRLCLLSTVWHMAWYGLFCIRHIYKWMESMFVTVRTATMRKQFPYMFRWKIKRNSYRYLFQHPESNVFLVKNFRCFVCLFVLCLYIRVYLNQHVSFWFGGKFRMSMLFSACIHIIIAHHVYILSLAFILFFFLWA